MWGRLETCGRLLIGLPGLRICGSVLEVVLHAAGFTNRLLTRAAQHGVPSRDRQGVVYANFCKCRLWKEAH